MNLWCLTSGFPVKTESTIKDITVSTLYIVILSACMNMDGINCTIKV